MAKASIFLAVLVGVLLLVWVKVLGRKPVMLQSTAPKWLTILAGLGLVTIASASVENCFITCYEPAGDDDSTDWENQQATLSPSPTQTYTPTCYTPTPTATPSPGYETPPTPGPSTAQPETPGASPATPTRDVTPPAGTPSPTASPTPDEVVAELGWRLRVLEEQVEDGRLQSSVLDVRRDWLESLMQSVQPKGDA